MADSLVTLPTNGDNFVELYSESGITAGTSLVIQNRGPEDLILVKQTAQPSKSDANTYGIAVPPNSMYVIPDGETAVWVITSYGLGRVNIQNADSSLPSAGQVVAPMIYTKSAALDKIANAFDTTDPEQPRLKTSTEITDAFGRSQMVSICGEAHVGFKVDDINVNFQYGVATYDTKAVVSGTGASGEINSMGYVACGAGVGSAIISSKDAIRYRAGHEVHGALSVAFGVPQTGVNQYAGFLNSSDGWAVGYQGTQFGLWFIEGGNVNFFPSSTWNIDRLTGTNDANNPSGYQINQQTGNLYRLSFGWHGFLPMNLEVQQRGTRKWIPCHSFESVNVATEPHLKNPNLPLAVKVERVSGSGADVTLFTGSWRAGSISGVAEDNLSNRWFAHTVLDRVITVGVNNNIFTFTNKATYNGKVNHLVVELAVVTFVNDTNKTVAIYGNKGGTLSGASAPVDIDTVNSVLSVTEGGTLTGGKRGPATVLKSGADRRIDVLGTGIKIYPGETFTFEVVSLSGGGTGSFSMSARVVQYN